jgi:Spy/CpxP family protein refolding chaperone
MTGVGAFLFALCLALPSGWADDEYGGGKGPGRGHGPGMGMMGMGMSGFHGGTGHFLRHLQKHSKEIGLSEDQVNKIKALQLDLDRARIKTEADIMVAEREAQALIEDEKSDLGAIEAKLKQAESFEVALRMTAIKTKRDAMALLTPEQRAKEKTEHEKMMEQHRKMGSGEGMMKGGPHPRGDRKEEGRPH